MSYDFSIEALMAESTGRVRREEVRSFEKLNGYDGYSDAIDMALAQASENLEFLDTYAHMNAKNASDKIRMLRKIKANYGVRSYNNNQSAAVSIESFCNRTMFSVEEEAAATGADATPADKPAEATKEEEKSDGKKDEKKVAWYKRMLEAIKKFFKAIWDKIKQFGAWLKKLFTGQLFKKKVKDAGGENANLVDDMSPEDAKEADAATKGAGEGKAPSPQDVASGQEVSLQALGKLDVIPFAVQYLGCKKMKATEFAKTHKIGHVVKFVEMIEKALVRIESLNKIIDNDITALEKMINSNSSNSDHETKIKLKTLQLQSKALGNFITQVTKLGVFAKDIVSAKLVNVANKADPKGGNAPKQRTWTDEQGFKRTEAIPQKPGTPNHLKQQEKVYSAAKGSGFGDADDRTGQMLHKNGRIKEDVLNPNAKKVVAAFTKLGGVLDIRNINTSGFDGVISAMQKLSTEIRSAKSGAINTPANKNVRGQKKPIAKSASMSEADAKRNLQAQGFTV